MTEYEKAREVKLEEAFGSVKERWMAGYDDETSFDKLGRQLGRYMADWGRAYMFHELKAELGQLVDESGRLRIQNARLHQALEKAYEHATRLDCDCRIACRPECKVIRLLEFIDKALGEKVMFTYKWSQPKWIKIGEAIINLDRVQYIQPSPHQDRRITICFADGEYMVRDISIDDLWKMLSAKPEEPADGE